MAQPCRFVSLGAQPSMFTIKRLRQLVATHGNGFWLV